MIYHYYHVIFLANTSVHYTLLMIADSMEGLSTYKVYIR